MNKPRAIVTLVHGTWARKAEWTQPASPMWNLLKQLFGDDVSIRSFRWSGSNTSRARMQAACDLGNYLKTSVGQYPEADHFVISHSHGGNVSLLAVQQAELYDTINVACLSTPFLTSIPRKFFRDEITQMTIAGPTIALAIGASGLITVWGWMKGGAIVVGVVATLIWLLRQMGSAKKMLIGLNVVPPPAARLLLLRMVGDEATLAIGAVQFAAWIIGSIVRRYFSVIRWFEIRGERLSHLAISSFGLTRIACCALLSGLVTVVWDRLFRDQGLAVRIVWDTLLWLLGTVLVFNLAFLVPGTVGLLMQAFLGFGLPPLVVIVALTLLPFDFHAAFASITLEICVEPLPPGAWMLHELLPDDSELHHSASYSTPSALDAIVDWISAITPYVTRPSPCVSEIKEDKAERPVGSPFMFL